MRFISLASFLEAVLKESPHHGYPVVNTIESEQVIIGFVRRYDLLEWLQLHPEHREFAVFQSENNPDNVHCQDIMIQPMILGYKTPLSTALDVFSKTGCRVVVVVSEGNAVCGILNRSDIVRWQNEIAS